MNASVLAAPPAFYRDGRFLLAAAVIIGIIAPFVVYPVFLMNALCWALFASAFNLLLGYVGLLSFGHAAYFGGAAYVTAYLMKNYGLPPELGILAGTAAATLMGAIFGAVATKRHGIAFSMVTLALAQMLYFYALQTPLSGGEDGIQSVPRGKLFGFIDLDQQMNLYFLVLGIFCIGMAIIHRAVHSPFGWVLKGIRQNEPRAISLGYKTSRYKFMAFVLSAGLSGLAGATQTLVFQIASLTGIHWAVSGEVVLMTILGGTATLLGPIVGAFVILAMFNYLAQFGSWVTVMQGVVFIVCVLAFRDGIVGELRNWLVRRQRRPSARPAQ
ncbi:MAG: branched-chain amino acid ABC transporter permease [Burkholderiaceae bacterium]